MGWIATFCHSPHNNASPLCCAAASKSDRRFLGQIGDFCIRDFEGENAPKAALLACAFILSSSYFVPCPQYVEQYPSHHRLPNAWTRRRGDGRSRSLPSSPSSCSNSRSTCPMRGLSMTMRISPSGLRKCSPDSTVDHLRYGSLYLGDQPWRTSQTSLRRRAVGAFRARGRGPVAGPRRGRSTAASKRACTCGSYICAKSPRRCASSGKSHGPGARARRQSRTTLLGQRRGPSRPDCDGNGLAQASPHTDLGLPAFPCRSTKTRPPLAVGCGGS